jgi:two-component system, OmpR family, sensor kinase
MTKRPTSLLNTLLGALLLHGIIAAILGVLIVYALVKEEYDELQDISLISKAHLLLELVAAQNRTEDIATMQDDTNPLSFEQTLMDEDRELTTFWVLDAAGDVVLRSPRADDAVLSARAKGGIVTALGYRIAEVSTPKTSLTIVTAISMGERNEAIRDVLFGVITGFFLLGALVAFASYRAVKRSVTVIADLSAEIETKDAHDLTPIDRKNTFAEIEPAIDTIDTLMVRLEATLQAERAFATNAAHELRTPVAISVAHVQRLRAKLTDSETQKNAIEIEQGLKRLTRLIERMLQMSRAQSGLGVSAEKADIVPIIDLLLRELRERVPSSDLLSITPPKGVWMSKVDPDAVGIILNNLFENAIRHSTGDAMLSVDASQQGQIIISNDCAPLSASDIEDIKQRYHRSGATSDGFGLGLSIVQDLCHQSGSTLELASPPAGKSRGFVATVSFCVT